jgi:hypothetical protein
VQGGQKVAWEGRRLGSGNELLGGACGGSFVFFFVGLSSRYWFGCLQDAAAVMYLAMLNLAKKNFLKGAYYVRKSWKVKSSSRVRSFLIVRNRCGMRRTSSKKK